MANGSPPGHRSNHWTYDPLLSLNAHLNISKLGTVCNMYLRDFYGAMRDEMNQGLPSDRFEVDWWVNTHRVKLRLSKRSRRQLNLLDFQKANSLIIPALTRIPDVSTDINHLILVEIPTDFLELKARAPVQAHEWRLYTRALFEYLFARGYIITDFVYEKQDQPTGSYYVLSHGEATL